jgi:sugar lactone lactonase YvrE
VFGPIGLAFDHSGNLFVANSLTSTIEKFTPGGIGTVFASGPGVNNPAGLAFDGAGNLFVANYGNGTVEKFTPGGVGSVFANLPGALNSPVGLAVDSAGNLFVSETDANTIQKFTPGGAGSLFASGLNGPQGLAFDSAGNLFAANNGTYNGSQFVNGYIEKFTPDGVGSVFASQNEIGSPFNTPVYIAIVPEPSVWQMIVPGMAYLVARWRARRRLCKPCRDAAVP